MESLHTVTEAARLLEVGRSTLYRHIRAGRVPYRTMSDGSIRLSEADVTATRSYLNEPVAVFRPKRRAA